MDKVKKGVCVGGWGRKIKGERKKGEEEGRGMREKKNDSSAF